GERLAVDEVHHEVWRAEDGVVVLAPPHARDRQSGGPRRLEEHELVPAARADVVPGWVAPEDESLGRAVRSDGVEGPRLSRRAAREAPEPRDLDPRDVEPARDVRGETLGELARHAACATPVIAEMRPGRRRRRAAWRRWSG